MDFLKQEILSKKRALDALSPSPGPAANSTAPPAKYIRRADLDRIRDDEQRKDADRRERERKERLYGKPKPASPAPATGDSAAPSASGSPAPPAAPAADKAEAFNVSNDEAVRRLRRLGQPIRLFGEQDRDRRLRLRALELMDERTEGQRNDFMRAMEGQELGLELEEVAKRTAAGKDKLAREKGKAVAAAAAAATADTSASATPEPAAAASASASAGKDGDSKEPRPKDEDVLVDLSLVKSNPHKIYPQIYHALKRVLKEWEQSLADRPEAVKRSTQGKVAAATQATSAEYLKPLFKSLRKRDLLPDVLSNIAEITHYMQTREYLRANDAYLRLSIGNSPWPIGVTMVGIHERSGREKIFSNNVAHVLNDETSRKYIQSLKRLLTFAQAVRPPDDVSQKVYDMD
ncbi:hypothetical protein Rhopal_007187-T1 [Rhodotorula paludigena]|uniref:Pre-mRNA-splicing factor 18 n=1 Tax=Rhodotorula paludigena TaxID=86838 RepID=A0AAV5GV65_9BASI|nr:hypothetical protein Rhopal_007187-T1 [Rhodotorula paludigena]